MLLDEDPALLISQTVSNFNIHPDRHTLSRISESLSTLQQARALRLAEAESSVRKLARNLSLLQSQHREIVASTSTTNSGNVEDGGGATGGVLAKHAAEISELDTKKFRIAKMTSDAEMEVERLEGELEGLRMRLSQIEAEGMEGGEKARRERESEDATM